MFKKLRRRRLRTAIALTLIVPPSAAFAWYPMTIFFEKDSVAFSNEAEIVLKAAKWSICYRGMMDVEIEADSATATNTIPMPSLNDAQRPCGANSTASASHAP